MSPCFVLDTKVRRVVEQQHSGQWTWVKDYVTRGGLQVGSVDNAGKVRHFYLDHLGSVRQLSDACGHYAGYHAYLPFGEEAPPIEHDGEVMKLTGPERDFNDDSLSRSDGTIIGTDRNDPNSVLTYRLRSNDQGGSAATLEEHQRTEGGLIKRKVRFDPPENARIERDVQPSGPQL